MGHIKITGMKLYKSIDSYDPVKKCGVSNSVELTLDEIDKLEYWELRRLYKQMRHTIKMIGTPAYGKYNCPTIDRKRGK